MKHYRVGKRLQELEREAHLLGLQQDSDSTRDRIGEWRRCVANTLSTTLSEDFDFLEKFRDVWRGFEEAPRDKRDHKKALVDSQMIIAEARELNMLLREDPENSAIAQDIHNIVSKRFLTSWWFLFPTALTFVAFGLAVAGTISIQGTTLDLDSRIDQARERIKELSKNAESGIEREVARVAQKADTRIRELLAPHAVAERARITKKASEFIRDLQQQPNRAVEQRLEEMAAEVDATEKSLHRIETRTTSLTDKTEVLKNSMRIIEGKLTDDLLEEVSALLGRSKTLVIVEILVACAVILLSLWNLYVLMKGWKTAQN